METYSNAALHHLGWLLLCEQLARYLHTPMAKAALECQQLAVWEGGVWADEAPVGPDQDQRVPALERCTEVARARDLLRELDGLERMYARAASCPEPPEGESPRSAR
ncbi:MAG: hypothetical protein ACPG77_16500, partial [Nannocystaceae bacterium]